MSLTDELPKQYHHAEPEQRWYQFWLSKGYFHSEPDPSGKKFPKGPYTIVIPPPNVTGALHLGHALNNTLQDILIRMKRMQGYNALWMPGTDHAGIATQAVVERRLLQEEKVSRHDLGREKLVERIWQWKQDYEKRILGQLQRMGCSCDWDRTRFTLDDMCARAVRHTFFKMFSDGLIYRGKRLVNWDTYLQTAVSDDEVFHETVQGHFWHFKYPVIDPKPGEPTHVTIATTRPETMLGDTAVAVHPDPAAALDKVEKEWKAKLAESSAKDKDTVQKQLDELAERRKTLLPQLLKLRDMALAGRKLTLPLVNRTIPLIADEWAKPELGSGCVKITPAHDPNDYEVGRRNPAIGMVNILNPEGTLNDAAGPYQGLYIKQARERVVADLEAQGLVVEIEDREIEIAHSDRSKTPIEPYLADQWFVKMDQLAQSAMDAVEDGRVKIFPNRYARSYLDWLSEKRDWPVSRQLWWGHRIPVWSVNLVGDDGTYTAWPSPELIERFKNALERFAASAGVAGELAFVQDNERPEYTYICAGTAKAESELNQFVARHFADVHVAPTAQDVSSLSVGDPREARERELVELATFNEQESDVLDTWFSSALWPHSTLGWPDETAELKYYYPTSTLVTSRDIITLWVARMVLAGLYNLGEIPFHEVFIHPKILDGFGEGMSKSKGNGVDPVDVMDKFGADALRFGLAYLTTETQDVRMPVDFECPHCQGMIEQTKKNRILPRVACKHCGKEFATQWAEKAEDKALPKGAVVSERFELARNFCNKLWNATRFALLNLEGYMPAPVADKDLAVEDRWLLSRLTTVTDDVTAAIDSYRYADAMRALYEFAWDEFCSFYVEMVKGRLQDEKQRAVAQRVLAHALDVLVRLLHPATPFLTEEIWQRLKDAAPQRGLEKPTVAAESIMIAAWPVADEKRRDEAIEQRFARFQEVLKVLREIRARQNIPPKTTIEFSVRCESADAKLLEPMAASFESLAGAKVVGLGPTVESPATAASVKLSSGELFVDLSELIDVPAEIARNEKELKNLQGMIAGKQAKLANHSFTDRAPADVVERERQSLVEAQARFVQVEAAIAELRKREKS